MLKQLPALPWQQWPCLAVIPRQLAFTCSECINPTVLSLRRVVLSCAARSQVQVKGLTPQADTPTFDGCTVRVKRMRSGRLERVLITGVPAPFRRGLTGCKVVNWELVWGEGQARQLQQVAGAGRQDGPGPLLVLEVVGAEGQADA